MKQKWKPTQYVEISIHEIFAFQDKLDAVKDDPEKVWQIVDDFFGEVENQLELSPKFLKELQNISKKDFVSLRVDNINELFEKDEDNFEHNYATAQDYVNYILYQRENDKLKVDPDLEYTTFRDKSNKRFKEDIPFSPRLNF